MRMIHIDEPLLEFGYKQVKENPQDGLFFYGPLDSQQPHTEVIRYGIVGTHEGIEQFGNWLQRVKAPIKPLEPEKKFNKKVQQYMVPFPGVEAAFGISIPVKPVATKTVNKEEVSDAIYCTNRSEGINRTVDIFASAIESHLDEEDEPVTLWFVVIPDDVGLYGRPKAIPPENKQTPSKLIFSNQQIRAFNKQKIGLLPFEELNEAVEVSQIQRNFHNLLKAKLLKKAVVQVIVERTLISPETYAKLYPFQRKIEDPCVVAWNLFTTAYYKAIGKPWKLANVRPGVCYVGLVFKQNRNKPDEGNACCGAQMFLNSSDGLVFKGAIGQWYSEDSGEYHLSKDKAEELMRLVVGAYCKDHGDPPNELFIHGQTYFNDDEWEGFQAAVPPETNLVGVRIFDTTRNPLLGCKLFRPGDYVALRGTALIADEKTGYLWTKGFVPRLDTYPGWETPNPLLIEIVKGKSSIEQVLEDVMALTKVNYNHSKYASGRPVTLQFADAVGEILTAATFDNSPIVQFKYCI